MTTPDPFASTWDIAEALDLKPSEARRIEWQLAAAGMAVMHVHQCSACGQRLSSPGWSSSHAEDYCYRRDEEGIEFHLVPIGGDPS